MLSRECLSRPPSLARLFLSARFNTTPPLQRAQRRQRPKRTAADHHHQPLGPPTLPTLKNPTSQPPESRPDQSEGYTPHICRLILLAFWESTSDHTSRGCLARLSSRQRASSSSSTWHRPQRLSSLLPKAGK